MAVAVIMKLRLDKYLTEMGCGTRSQVKKEILKGSVSVNGEIAKKAERKVDTEKDEIIFKGEKIFYAGYEYFMLNKPAGVVSATEDKKERTVIDLIKESKRKDLFPAGRLDKDTEGLLLITNDGQLAHRLLSPKKHVDKIYYAKIKGIVTEEDVRLFEKGVHIGDEKPTMPAALEILSVQKERRKEKIKEQKILPETKNETDEKEDGYSEIYLTIKGYCQFEYIKNELRDLFALADVVISRAGANAICELLALRKPNLLIPLSARASRGDQILNAHSFERQGFSLVIEEEQLTNATLLDAVHNLYENREQFNQEFLKTLDSYQVDLVVLAGFLVVIPPAMIQKYENRIINIHPSLIPSFCGKGFYGLKVHDAVLARGVKVTGATVHFVDAGTDTGPIILQKAVKVKDGDTSKELQRRVMEKAEWKILPEAINLIANDKITVTDGIVSLK